MIRKKNHRHPAQAPFVSLQILPPTHALSGVIVKMAYNKCNRKSIRVFQHLHVYVYAYTSAYVYVMYMQRRRVYVYAYTNSRHALHCTN